MEEMKKLDKFKEEVNQNWTKISFKIPKMDLG